jgi:predicted nucleic-acid-binding protein
MLLIDANAILRYTLNDNKDMAAKTRDLIINNKVYIRYEVLAEVIYVLSKVYLLPRKEICDGITLLLSCSNVETDSREVALYALNAFAEINMDFVDCLLYAFRAVNGYDIFTFDKKLNAVIGTLSAK